MWGRRDGAGLVAGYREPKLEVVARQHVEAVAPLDRDHSIAAGSVVEPQLAKLDLAFDAVKVGVRQRQPASFVVIDERERRARHSHTGRYLQPFGHALDEQGLAGTQIAGQAQRVPGAQTAPEGSRQLARGLGAVDVQGVAQVRTLARASGVSFR